MKLGDHDLQALAAALADNPALGKKRDVQRAARVLGAQPGAIANGDDAAAIPDGQGGYTLLAAEGMLPEFVAADPFFAGFCAVMTNVSDIAAMGGRPLALVDVLWSDERDGAAGPVLDGLARAAEVFGVPVVGGHSGRSRGGSHLAAAIVGKARALISSFAARPGDRIVVAVDVNGRYRGTSQSFDAASEAEPEALRKRLALLPELAEAGLVGAGKDISMAGLAGTLAMLLETSGCGATLDLGALPAPAGAERAPLRWLSAFPSYGYVLSVAAPAVATVLARFAARGVRAADAGSIDAGHTLALAYEGGRVPMLDLRAQPLLGFAPRRDGERHA